MKYVIEGMKELEKTIKTLEKLPQKCVTKAAKKGMTIALKAARKNAPEDTGELKKGIIIKGERARTKGKKVYDVMMDPAKSDIFQRTTRTGQRRFRKGKKVTRGAGNYYYPASQEVGFATRNGGYVPGFHFLKSSLEDNKTPIEKEIVTVLSKEIDKLK